MGPFVLLFVVVIFGLFELFLRGFCCLLLVFISSFLRMKNFTLRAGSTISVLLFLDIRYRR